MDPFRTLHACQKSLIALLGVCPMPAAVMAQGAGDVDFAQANNPLASFKTLNFQNQYNGSLTDLNDKTSNSFFLRDPAGKHRVANG